MHELQLLLQCCERITDDDLWEELFILVYGFIESQSTRPGRHGGVTQLIEPGRSRRMTCPSSQKSMSSLAHLIVKTLKSGSTHQGKKE